MMGSSAMNRWLLIPVFAIFTGIASSQQEKVLFAEQFAGKLDKEWSWVREDPKAWKLQDGVLVIKNLPGYLHAKYNNSQNILLRPLAKTDTPGSKDPDILQRAVTENRVLLTFDKDSGELAFQFGLPASCGIVLFRLQASSSAALAVIVVAAIQSRTDWAGNFSVIDPGCIRIRALPAQPA